MASGTLLDLNSSGDSAPGRVGPRAFLTRANMIGLRVLLVLYVPTIALIVAMNYQPVGHAVFGLISQHLWVALTFGIMAVLAVSTFLVLLGMMLYYGVVPTLNVLWLPLFLLLTLVTALGVGLCLPRGHALQNSPVSG